MSKETLPSMVKTVLNTIFIWISAHFRISAHHESPKIVLTLICLYMQSKLSFWKLFKQIELYSWVSFNPELALIGFWTTGPCYCCSVHVLTVNKQFSETILFILIPDLQLMACILSKCNDCELSIWIQCLARPVGHCGCAISSELLSMQFFNNCCNASTHWHTKNTAHKIWWQNVTTKTEETRLGPPLLTSPSLVLVLESYRLDIL